MFVRSNKDSFEEFYNEAYQITDELNHTVSLVTDFLSNAPNMIPNTDYEEEHEDIDPEGNPYTWTETIERWQKEKNAFRSLCNGSNFNKCTPLSVAANKIRKVAEALETIYKFILQFEEDGLQNVSLKDAFSNTEHISVELVDGVEVLYYDLDGEKITIAELTNAFYTYSGMTMDTMIQGYLTNTNFGTSIDLQKNALDAVHSFVGSALHSRAFGVASNADILNTAQDLGVNTKISEVQSIFANTPNTEVNSYITTNALVAGFAVLGAYSLTNHLPLKEDSPTINQTGGSVSKPYKPESSSDSSLTPNTNTSKVESVENNGENNKPLEPNISESTPPLTENISPTVEITNESIPDILTFEEVDYDAMAVEEFESLDFEEVTEHTNQVVEEALTLFETEDKTKLKEKLTQFGYSDPEINQMIENRDYVVTAFIESDRKEQLARIANRLADKDGIKGFDTSYDDGQQYKDLTNGLSSKFIIDMGNDPKVTEARNRYWNAREKVQEKIQEANASIEGANRLKQSLNILEKDRNTWSKEQVEKYNSTVTQYNQAVKEANEKVSFVKQAKELYQNSKNAYMASKENYLKEITTTENNSLSINNQNETLQLDDKDVLESVQI